VARKKKEIPVPQAISQTYDTEIVNKLEMNQIRIQNVTNIKTENMMLKLP